MGKSFDKFWSDYNEMCIKPQVDWFKLHWKGYIVVLAASYACGFAIGKAIEKVDEIKTRKYYEKMYENKEEEA